MMVARAGRGPHSRSLLGDMRWPLLRLCVALFCLSLLSLYSSLGVAAPARAGASGSESTEPASGRSGMEGAAQPEAPTDPGESRSAEGQPAGAPTASAEEDLQAVYREGEQAYQERDYARAVQLFQRVYRYRPHPNILFNIARCFEELRSYEEAIGFYEDYLSRTPEGEERDQVAQSLRALRALNLQEQRAERRRRWRWGSYGGAVLFYGLAAGFAIATASTRAELDDATSTGMSPARYKELQDQGVAQAAWADSLFLIGSGALGLGLYFQFSDDAPVGAPSTASSPSAWRLSIGPGTLRLSF